MYLKRHLLGEHLDRWRIIHRSRFSCEEYISYWMALRQTATFVNKRTKCWSHVFLFTFSTVELPDSLQSYFRIWCKAFPASVRNLSQPLSLLFSVSLLCNSHNERNFNELLCKGSEDLPALCSPKAICHAYFIQCAYITFDYILIGYFLNVFSHSSCFMKSYLHKHWIFIQVGTLLILHFPQLHLNSTL